MGEIAEMILEGVLCQCCGVVLDDIVEGEEAPGYPSFVKVAKNKKDPLQWASERILIN